MKTGTLRFGCSIPEPRLFSSTRIMGSSGLAATREGGLWRADSAPLFEPAPGLRTGAPSLVERDGVLVGLAPINSHIWLVRGFPGGLRPVKPFGIRAGSVSLFRSGSGPTRAVWSYDGSLYFAVADLTAGEISDITRFDGPLPMASPFVWYDAASDRHFLFFTVGRPTPGGGCQIRLLRSRKPEGPWLDMNGEAYGLKLMGSYILPSMDQNCLAPGSPSVLEADGQLLLCFERRFWLGSDYSEPRIHPLFRTPDGWLTVSPFPAYAVSPVSRALTDSELGGVWHVLSHGYGIDRSVTKSRPASLASQPEALELDGSVYSGAAAETTDEAGNRVLAISAVGSNTAVWAVKYEIIY